LELRDNIRWPFPRGSVGADRLGVGGTLERAGGERSSKEKEDYEISAPEQRQGESLGDPLSRPPQTEITGLSYQIPLEEFLDYHKLSSLLFYAG
jgi:hypothetical protein